MKWIYLFKILIIIFFSNIKTKENKNKNIPKGNRKTFYPETDFDEILSSINAKNYINISINELKIFNRTINIRDKPNLSVVIPIYNKEKIIKRTI